MSTALNHRALKKADPILQQLRKFFDSLLGNSKGVLGLIAVFLVIVAAASAWMHHRSEKTRESLAAFYSAKKIYASEFEALVPKKVEEPAAVASKTGAKAVAKKPAKPAPNPADEIEYKKLDTDTSFAKSIAAFQGVAKSHPGTEGGYDALLSLGRLYLDHGAADKSLAYFDQALENAKSPDQKVGAHFSKAIAFENLDRLAEAKSVYEKSVNQGETLLRPEVLLSLSRVQIALHQESEAQTSLDKVIKEYAGTEFAQRAQDRKQALGGPSVAPVTAGAAKK